MTIQKEEKKTKQRKED